MWIEPNSIVQILQNVPLDMNWDNTIYFSSREAQHQYFANKTKITRSGRQLYFSRVTYQRVRRNYMRLEVNAEELYDCNYLMFQNTAFGSSRWFYAFITGTEYVANEVTEISYVIDPMQTWFFDCELRQSYVEREHIAQDVFGANRVEENIECGDYLLVNSQFSPDSARSVLNKQAIVLATTTFHAPLVADAQAKPNMVGNIMGALKYYIFPFDFNDTAANKEQALSNFYDLLQYLVEDNKTESIVKVFQCPAYFFYNLGTDPNDRWNSINIRNDIRTVEPYTFQYAIARPTKLGDYNGWVTGSEGVHNRKLLQYPYNFLFVSDGRGGSAQYLFEDSNHSELVFQYMLVGSCDPSMVISPIDYRLQGKTNYDAINYNERFIMKGYPECSFSINGFLAYMAQNGGVIPTITKDIVTPVASAVSNIMGIGIGQMKDKSILQNNAEHGRVGTNPSQEQALSMINAHGVFSRVANVSNVITDLGSFVAKMNLPAQAQGNYNGDVIYSSGLYDFVYAQKCIYPQNAARMDKFFDMFGYATKTIKTPNINSRDHWNYVKVQNANIVGNIPADDLQLIKDILTNGITFWKNPYEVGDYTLDNWSSAWA